MEIVDRRILQYEGLGYFYLGKKDGATGNADKGEPMLYKSENLTTHAAIIGMTGSGKTGLGVCLIEEAALDNIPSLVIDPKGDMGNLLLAFPELKPGDFLPWVESAAAESKGISREELARQTAENWKNGLESSQQPVSRIGAYILDREISIYTPGSSAGRELSLLADFSAPPEDLLRDTDTFNALVQATVASLLALAGVQADPLQSVEFLLLSAVVADAWQNGEDLSLETLIARVIQPPFRKLGVLPLETVAPENRRMNLAMRLNGILSNPGSNAWIRGEALDIGKLLFDERGKARVTILSIAHLGDRERMFFVTLFLNRFIAWMRRQAGTSGLRALLYMDEIFGYFPATANPPSKEPMLLILKQARAFGIGVVLATQNPVDLDYKGLANIGSWFLGRLQTPQDVARVLGGLVSEGNSMDREEIRNLLTRLKGRHFILKNARENTLVSFETRWTLSFLRGPVTEAEIRTLTATPNKKTSSPKTFQEEKENHRQISERGEQKNAPILSSKIPQAYSATTGGPDCIFFPYLLGFAEIRYYNQSRAIDELTSRILKLPLSEDLKSPSWEDGEWLEKEDKTLSSPPSPCRYGFLPAFLTEASRPENLEKAFADHLYKTCKLSLFRCRAPKLESRPGESLHDFRLRLSGLLREKRDTALEKMKTSHGEKEKRLLERLEKARMKLEKEEKDVSAKKTDTFIHAGLALADFFFGGKRSSRGTISRAGSTLKQGKRIFDEREDVKLAEISLKKMEEELAALQDQFSRETADLDTQFSPDTLKIEEFFIAPRKSDVKVKGLVILWEAEQNNFPVRKSGF